MINEKMPTPNARIITINNASPSLSGCKSPNPIVVNVVIIKYSKARV